MSRCEQLFPNTQWTLVVRAREGATEALNTLCTKYRRPLLIWLQGRIRELHGLEPEDLVNGFLASKLEHKILKAAEQTKGKFRAFVRTCLNNYVKDELSKLNARMRGGGVLHQSVDESDEDGRPLVEPASPDASADQEYDRAWGLVILASAIRRLEDELSRKGHLPLWKRLEPLLYEVTEAPGYEAIAKEFGMAPATLHTVAFRIRKRLRTLIREELKETVASEEDFEAEIKEFIGLFGRSASSERAS